MIDCYSFNFPEYNTCAWLILLGHSVGAIHICHLQTVDTIDIFELQDYDTSNIR